MSTDRDRTALRIRISRVVLTAGVVVAHYALLGAIRQIEGAKCAGGTLRYLGVTRWQDSLPFVIWAFSLPLAGALAFMAAALRNTAIPVKLATLVPLGFMATCVAAGLYLDFPTIVPGFFGVGGALIAACLVTTLSLGGAQPRRSGPEAWILKSLGYLSFASAAWFTCGLLSTPGAVMLPALEHSQAVISDLSHKIMLFWVSGWVLTALGAGVRRRGELSPSLREAAHR